MVKKLLQKNPSDLKFAKVTMVLHSKISALHSITIATSSAMDTMLS